MRSSNMLVGLLLALLGLVQALSSAGSRLLVLSDDVAEDQSKYSKFLGDLKSRDFALTFASAKEQPQLFALGERAFDHVLVLPTSLKALGPTLTPQLLLDFARAEGNIMLALSASKPPPSPIVSLLLELDMQLPPARDSVLVDHFAYDAASAPDKHDVLLLQPGAPARSDVRAFFAVDAPVAFPSAVPQLLGAASPLLAGLVRAPATAYAYGPADEPDGVDDVFATGAQLQIASAMQARNGARITVLGAADALADAWFDASVRPASGKKVTSANRAFAAKLTAWAFKETGVLRVDELRHYLASGSGARGSNSTSVADIVADDEDVNPKIYRIMNEVTYEVALSEYASTHWIPFVPPGADILQLEFSMLSPYQRLTLQPSHTILTPGKNATLFTTTFHLPDQHGIFNFRFNYKRPLLSPIDEKRTVTVRHFAHDEFPRSFAILGAYPWIVGIVAVMVGWFGFVVVWLYSSPSEKEMGGPFGKKAT